MKKIVANVATVIGFAFGDGVMGSAALAGQPPLINPGPESPAGDNDIPVAGVAHAPAQPGPAVAARHFADHSGLVFYVHSPVEAFVVDPLGRREGIDSRTGAAYNEIPRSYYGTNSTIGPVIPTDYEPPKVLDIVRPEEGLYTLTVVGTGNGIYNADFVAYDLDLNRSRISMKDVPTAPGLVHTYQIDFAKAVGSQIQVAGGFDGGGQRPRDVNRFLTYASPDESTTTLPMGTASHSLLLFYAATIVPSSFSAQLNGTDVTALFHPAAGSGEKVSFELQPGRNVLVLSVDGNLPNRMATDTDRLVFDVP